MMAINQICSERNLSQDVIVEAIETALVSAFKKNFPGGGQNIRARIDMRTGIPSVYAERIVVQDAQEVQDERFEISLQEAQRIMPDAQPGSLILTDITPKEFGRIAAQTAKQVVLQRIREAERDALFSSFVDREGELINGTVASITANAITLNLGRAEAVLPRSQQVPGERYKVGQRVRAFVTEVRKTSRGPQIVASRTHRNMLRRMLEVEVPEIFNGTVEIKSITREAGSRSKVAVSAVQEGIDPVGSCVGIRGMRIQSIVNELGGEKIDVVAWNPDSSTFIINSLSPARVSYVILDETANPRTATVVVADDQLSLAIGKEGQNARLAAKLTGWRIDIKSESVAATEGIKPHQPLRISVMQEKKDILAMAEAILLGKTAPTPQTPLVEPVIEPAEQAEVTIAAETLEPEPEPATHLAEPVISQVAQVQVAPQAAPQTAQPPAPASESATRRPRFEFVPDDDFDTAGRSKKKVQRKKRQLVRNETSGELIIQRKHKRGEGIEFDWEDTDL